jgi:hypothetical protein
MDAPVTLSFVYSSAARTVYPPRHGCGWKPHNAAENRPPVGRSGSPRILPLRVLDEARGQHRNVVSAENIDVAGVNVDQADLSVAIAAAAAMATSGGYEVELLIGQFDRVSKIGNVLHVGLLLM